MATNLDTQHLFYSWCWAPKPFYTYMDSSGLGWANAVDFHPGLFNLMWAAAGGPISYAKREEDTHYCAAMYCEALFIPIRRQRTVRLHLSDLPRVGVDRPPKHYYTLADAAFEMPLKRFLKAYTGSTLALSWRFRTQNVKHAELLARMYRAVEAARA